MFQGQLVPVVEGVVVIVVAVGAECKDRSGAEVLQRNSHLKNDNVCLISWGGLDMPRYLTWTEGFYNYHL